MPIDERLVAADRELDAGLDDLTEGHRLAALAAMLTPRDVYDLLSAFALATQLDAEEIGEASGEVDEDGAGQQCHCH